MLSGLPQGTHVISQVQAARLAAAHLGTMCVERPRRKTSNWLYIAVDSLGRFPRQLRRRQRQCRLAAPIPDPPGEDIEDIEDIAFLTTFGRNRTLANFQIGRFGHRRLVAGDLSPTFGKRIGNAKVLSPIFGKRNS